MKAIKGAIVNIFKKIWSAIVRFFYKIFPKESATPAPVMPDDVDIIVPPPFENDDPPELEEETPEDTIAKAIWFDQLGDLTLEELDELAAEFWAEDEDVEIIYDSVPEPEAGIEGHGEHSEEDKMFTYEDYEKAEAQLEAWRKDGIEPEED